jgi:hypothetical protein
MSDLLRFDDGRLAVTADGRLIVSDGQCCAFLIAVWNSNAVIDDNFDVELNGTVIGQINNNSNTCTGRIFSTNTDVTAQTLALDSLCRGPCGSDPNFEATVLLDAGLLIEGDNSLRLIVARNNGFGNFGSLLVARVIRAAKWAIDKRFIVHALIPGDPVVDEYAFLGGGVGFAEAFHFHNP